MHYPEKLSTDEWHELSEIANVRQMFGLRDPEGGAELSAIFTGLKFPWRVDGAVKLSEMFVVAGAHGGPFVRVRREGSQLVVEQLWEHEAPPVGEL